MTVTSVSAYQTVADMIERVAGVPSPRFLDFGCGKGQLVAIGRARGLDIWGADNFSYSESWKDAAALAARDRIVEITDGRLPFPDRHFDVVVANMVFEHVQEPLPVLREIARVLKPRGRFLALFPIHETWFEGHLGLYFPHWLQGHPRLQRAYLAAAYSLGFGFQRKNTRDRWIEWRQRAMGTTIFFHREQAVMDWWQQVFGDRPQDLGPDYMRSRMPSLQRVPNAVLSAVCRRRVGLVLLAGRDVPEPALESELFNA